MEERCKGLWFSVLERAIKDLRGFYGLSLQDNAETWLLSGNKGVGSYLWICSVLNLDPSSIRRSLINCVDEDLSMAENKRQGVRSPAHFGNDFDIVQNIKVRNTVET